MASNVSMIASKVGSAAWNLLDSDEKLLGLFHAWPH